MIYKYTKDVAFKIGRRIVRSVIDTYLDDGKKIFRVFTYNWFTQEENAAEMMCDGCKICSWTYGNGFPTNCTVLLFYLVLLESCCLSPAFVL